MKKVLFCILVFALALLTLTACSGKRTDAVKAVESMIKEIHDISLDSEEAILAAQKAYAVLTVDEKKAVRNYDDLQDAAEELKALKNTFSSYDDMNKVIDKIMDTANSTYTSNDTDFSALIEQGEAIIEQYKDLNKEGKEYVKVTDDLSAAIHTLKESVDRTTASAAEYVKAFNTVNAEKKYTVTGVYCIKQVRDQTEYHIFALTYQDTDGNEHSVFANARCSANTVAETIVNNADTFFAGNAVSEDYNAVKNGNVTIDLETVLKAAK